MEIQEASNLRVEEPQRQQPRCRAFVQKIKSMVTDKESNGMLNLVTLWIKDKEAQEDYKQHKLKVFYEWAELGFTLTVLRLGMHALNYWVLNKTNIP